MTATLGGRFISLVSLAILARILAPEDFGLLAFALVFLGYLETVGDLGTGAALVYWSDRWRDVAQLTFVVNLLMGGLWMGIALVAAPWVSDFFGSPDGVPVVRALAWAIPLKALGTTHDALLQRDLRFRTRLVPEIALLAVKAGVSVALALKGFGVWSLVWGQVAGQAVSTGLLWALVRWRPRIYLPGDLVGPVFKYGRGIVSVNVLAAVVHHVDIVIVGRMFSLAVLGIYQMAYKVPDMAVTLVVRVTSKVLFPALSRLKGEGGELRDMYLPALRYLSLITVPATVGLVLLAEPIVRVLLGDGWLDTVPILRAIAVYAGLKALGSNVGDLLKATGRPGTLALLGIARAVVLVPALIVAGHFSALSVAFTLVGVTLISTAVNLAVAGRLLDVRWGAIGGALSPSFSASLPLVMLLLFWSRLAENLPNAVHLFGGVLVGGGVYLLTLAYLDRNLFHRALELICPPSVSVGSGAADGASLGPGVVR
jgi:O-antigen/teichoic acid export membrane protein